jgi:hypothetical protein
MGETPMLKKLTSASFAGLALTVAMVAPAAAQNRAGDSLVNVQISDVTIAVPIAIAANLCDIDVNVLATQTDVGRTTCTADATSIATPGTGGGHGGNRAGDSLVNVQVSDLTVLLPVGIAANVCDVNANVLAEQLEVGRATCDAVANAQT